MTNNYTKYFIQACLNKNSPYYLGNDEYYIWSEDEVDTLEQALEELEYCRGGRAGATHTFRILKREYITEDLILEH